MKQKVAVIYDDEYLKHDTGAHPENADRLRRIMAAIAADPVGDEIAVVKPQSAPVECVVYVHSIEYIREVEEACLQNLHFLDADTVICPDSYRVALLAAGGVMTAVDTVMGTGPHHALALVRPPGHHAEPERAMGFCLFNNMAIGVRYAQKRYGLERAAIVDWDVHHGNGTQRMFYTDPSVLFISLHQFPLYPGSGTRGEQGIADGRGYTMNFPMLSGSGDKEYLAMFNEHIVPRLDEFRPQIVFISAGFDGHRDDPLAGMNLTDDGYAAMTEILVQVSLGHCEGRLVSVLEGGYNLAILPGSVLAHLRALSGM